MQVMIEALEQRVHQWAPHVVEVRQAVKGAHPALLPLPTRLVIVMLVVVLLLLAWEGGHLYQEVVMRAGVEVGVSCSGSSQF
jgi:hypothetical protein